MIQKNDVDDLRANLIDFRKNLAQLYFENPNPAKLFKTNTLFHDRLLKDIWHSYLCHSNACLIAVGGYGRQEQYPYSDIDILILTASEDDIEVNNRIEALIGFFWDIGLAIGQSVRTINHCMQEAGLDISVMTNLLESRYLCGEKSLYKALCKRIKDEINPKKFFLAKLEEQNIRHKRFNDSAYNLEPNIKESPGGLRDLHVILWVSRGIGVGENWKELYQNSFISSEELKLIRRYERRMQDLRIRLHFLANRREDRLIFDFQNELSETLGYASNARYKASERLMRSFYEAAKLISLINELLIKQFKKIMLAANAPIKKINASFYISDRLLECDESFDFSEHQAGFFEVFLHQQTYPEIDGMGPSLIRKMYQSLHFIDSSFRKKSEHQALFLTILKQPIGVHRALMDMNRYGVLSRYIPAFKKIVGQMQHDLFHVYTVDEHILRVIGNLERFSQPEFSHEFPLCSELFNSFNQQHLLYIAALFHDIAKGRGGDHSELGQKDAKAFCRLNQMKKEDELLVAWLVKAHLMMSATAQKSDLSDPNIIHQFSRAIVSERRLTALYLLTVADIRGTSPKVWNSWKAKLLETLYRQTREHLQDSVDSVEREISARKKDAVEKLSHYGIYPEKYQTHWQVFGENYFLRYDATDIVWHTRLLLAHLKSSEAIVRARLSPGGDGIQVMIYLHDRENLFAQLCQCFESLGFSILEARIHTTTNDYALDTFLISELDDKTLNYRDLLSYIEYELSNNLSKNLLPQPPTRGRINRQVKHMPINTQVTIFSQKNQDNSELDIITADRPGLLSTIAYAMYQHRVKILNAKINTLGFRVEDRFVISPTCSQKLAKETLESLKQDLLEQLQ
jgi:[protein-PII] uridylyltransferase